MFLQIQPIIYLLLAFYGFRLSRVFFSCISNFFKVIFCIIIQCLYLDFALYKFFFRFLQLCRKTLRFLYRIKQLISQDHKLIFSDIQISSQSITQSYFIVFRRISFKSILACSASTVNCSIIFNQHRKYITPYRFGCNFRRYIINCL